MGENHAPRATDSRWRLAVDVVGVVCDLHTEPRPLQHDPKMFTFALLIFRTKKMEHFVFRMYPV